MTNTEIIQAIRNEIERQIALLPTVGYSTQIAGDYIPVQNTLNYLISFLSTLESEKPMNQDESLNEEIKKEMANLPFFIRGKDQIAFARHFAQWGADHTPLPEDTVIYQKGVAEGKRLMMEEARPHFVLRILSGNHMKKMIELYNDEVDCKPGDVVRAIIFKKED